jgi:hypothetical protein
MSWIKDLLIKDEGDDDNKPSEKNSEKLSFPISGGNSSGQENFKSNNPYLEEIIQVYEKGLESINMPGYDFYEFYAAVKVGGSNNEAVYKMAFQMGKTMDASVTAEKLVNDAEYYLSKINEVYQQYSSQGRQKLEGLSTQQRNESESLTSEATKIEAEMVKLKQQLQTLDKKLAETKSTMSKMGEKYKPQQDAIQQKLNANDKAMEVSTQKINSIKDGISRFLK